MIRAYKSHNDYLNRSRLITSFNDETLRYILHFKSFTCFFRVLEGRRTITSIQTRAFENLPELQSLYVYNLK